MPGRAALTGVVLHWRALPSRLIWTYAIGIGAFYGVIPLVPLLLQQRQGVGERQPLVAARLLAAHPYRQGGRQQPHQQRGTAATTAR